MTNADRIRNMTDEELVRYLTYCPVTARNEDCIHSYDTDCINCEQCIRNWLQSEVKEGE